MITANSRTFSSPQKETLCPLAVIPHIPLFPSADNPDLLSESINLSVLDISYKSNCIIVPFCVSLLSLSVMFSEFIIAVAWITTSFLFITQLCPICRDIPHFIQPFIHHGHVGCLCILAVMNNVVDISIHCR